MIPRVPEDSALGEAVQYVSRCWDGRSADAMPSAEPLLTRLQTSMGCLTIQGALLLLDRRAKGQQLLGHNLACLLQHIDQLSGAGLVCGAAEECVGDTCILEAAAGSEGKEDRGDADINSKKSKEAQSMLKHYQGSQASLRTVSVT